MSIHLSAKLSGTLESARLASDQLPDVDVHLVRNDLPPIGVGLLAVEAAQAANSGASAEAVVELVNELGARTYVAFVVPTLEYLRRGGRIGGAQAFVGSILSFKPVLHVQEGEVQPVIRVRSFTKARRALVDYVRERAPNGLQSISVMHVGADDMYSALEADIQREFDVSAALLPGIEMGAGDRHPHGARRIRRRVYRQPVGERRPSSWSRRWPVGRGPRGFRRPADSST